LEAAPPEICSVIPNTGSSNTSKQVTISGEGFKPTPRGCLYGGGPYITSSFDTPDFAYGVYIQDSFAYVADRYSGLQIIDISDPEKPSFKGIWNTPGEAIDVYVQGSFAYVADGESGLRVIDISSPENPSIVGSCNTLDYAIDVYVQGSYAYVADGISGIQVIDISSPANPAIVGSCDTPSYARAVHVQGGYVYVADHGNGRIQKFLIDGTFVSKTNCGGSYGVTVSKTGFLYVSESPYPGS